MLSPYGGFPATLLRDGRVLVGDIEDPTVEDSVAGAEVYDPASGTWTVTGKMVDGGGGESTATLLRDGRVLLIGDDGTGSSMTPSGTLDAHREDDQPAPQPCRPILLADGNVLVAGGHAPGDHPTDSAELYDPDTGTWTAIANMQAPRDNIEAFLQPDGKVLVVGGYARAANRSH